MPDGRFAIVFADSVGACEGVGGKKYQTSVIRFQEAKRRASLRFRVTCHSAKNVAADPVRNYEIAPKEIVRLMGELRERRLEFLGIYHSHPNWLDTNEPSPKRHRAGLVF